MQLTTWRRWRRFRTRQRAALRESNRFSRDVDEQLERDLLVDAVDDSGRDPGLAAGPGSGGEPREARHFPSSTYGPAGRPLNKHSPFYVGFVGALGALVAIGLWHSVGRLATTLSILLIAFFLTLTLNPLVEAVTRRGARRGFSVTVVFAGLLVVFGLIGLLVIPPVVEQGTQLTQNAPAYFQRILDSRIVQQADRNFDVVDRVQVELTRQITDRSFMSAVFGGVLGAGRAVLNGVFQTLTVLILTLYFLVSFPRMKRAAYEVVPASRRPRVISLSEEIMRRVGAYALGQAAVATINASLSYVMMLVLGIPYAAVLAVVVGLLGLVPMVGATLGAALVCLVAVFDQPRLALVAALYYLVYQQIENYVIAPRIMQRTVSVPGAVTVVAALAGATLLGVLGALLAIPAAAGLLLIYEEVIVPRQRTT